MNRNFKNFIFFNHFQGQTRKGVGATSNVIRQNFLHNSNLHSSMFIDVPFYNSVYNNIYSLYSINYRFEEKKMNIGGDHSMSIGSLGYSVNKFPNVKTLWFDAHADINTKDSSPSGNLHGMPLSILTGIEKNNNFFFLHNYLKVSNIMYIGLRDIDPYEQFILDKYNIPVISCNEFNNNPKKSLEQITTFVGDSPFHLSFDVDCLDPSIIPCTGTPVSNGLHLEPTKYVLHNLFPMKNLVNMDLTELNVCDTDFSKDNIHLSLQNIFKIFY